MATYPTGSYLFLVPNVEARYNVAMGSLLGGIAFANAGIGAVHALSYPIGDTFHEPHGVANTLMLPWVMEFNMIACLPYFRDIAEAMGENTEGLSDREAAPKPVEAMKQLPIDIQVPQYLSDVGIAESAIDETPDSALTQTRLLVNNPRQLLRDDIVQIYRNAATRPGAKPVRAAPKKAAPAKKAAKK